MPFIYGLYWQVYHQYFLGRQSESVIQKELMMSCRHIVQSGTCIIYDKTKILLFEYMIAPTVNFLLHDLLAF